MKTVSKFYKRTNQKNFVEQGLQLLTYAEDGSSTQIFNQGSFAFRIGKIYCNIENVFICFVFYFILGYK